MEINSLEKEKILSSVDIIVSQSDLDGFIIYANPIFYKIAGYNYGELVGENHNIIRHKDMPKSVFKILWDELKQKNEVYCLVKNQCKDGGFYWVFAYIRPSFNRDGTVRNYISTRRAASQKARAIIEPLYKELLEIESKQGVALAEERYKAFLEIHQYRSQSNNEIIYNIQY
jgi:PAS domain S-box-containing protein